MKKHVFMRMKVTDFKLTTPAIKVTSFAGWVTKLLLIPTACVVGSHIYHLVAAAGLQQDALQTTERTKLQFESIWRCL